MLAIPFQSLWRRYSSMPATAARPAASVSRWRARSVRCAHFFAGSWCLLAGGVGAVPGDGLVVEIRRVPANSAAS